MLQVSIGYPDVDVESEIMEAQRESHPVHSLVPVSNREEVLKLQSICRRIFVKPSLRTYIARLSLASREHPDVLVGTSVRGSQRLMHAAQAYALINHREYILPDDVQALAKQCLCHRLMLRPEAMLAGVTEVSVVEGIVSQVPVPEQ
ncbi:MoxR family ATPase, partial [bacterium]|nr:MoxR family ATPase [bacterium]